MKVVIAIDSFKGSLSSRDAGRAACAGVAAACQDAEIDVIEVADGGEGTVSALLAACAGRRVSVEGVDAVGRPCTADYGLLDDGTAVLESAATIGLTTVGPVDGTLPARASSYGLGLQVRHALGSGARRVLVGLGGTATTDGGTGLLAALGAQLYDDVGRRLTPDDGNLLWRFARLDPATVPELDGVELIALSDVTNPLLGPTGAAAVYGPQKGADPADVAHLDQRMTVWAAALDDAMGGATAAGTVAAVPGSGAAGGIGAALLALGGRIDPGFGHLAKELGVAGRLRGSDLVLTGEGSVDAQTAHGKVPSGVAALGRAAGALVVALGGSVRRDVPGVATFDAAFSVHSRPRSLSEAMDPRVTADEVAATAQEVVRLVLRARDRGDRA